MYRLCGGEDASTRVRRNPATKNVEVALSADTTPSGMAQTRRVYQLRFFMRMPSRGEGALPYFLSADDAEIEGGG